MFHNNVSDVATFPQQTISGGMLGAMAIVALLALLTPLTITVTSAPPSPPQKMVAIVDDSDQWANIAENIVSRAIDALGGGIPIQRYTNGELLIVEMKAGKRFRVYIVDNRLDDPHRIMWGPEITREIRAIQPDAVVIGLSSEIEDPGFVANGAKQFIKKGEIDITEMANLIKSFLQ